jgi:hypothetical protein
MLRDRVERMSEQDHRRWLLVGVPMLVAFALLFVVPPWAIWPLVTATIWLVAIGIVVLVAVRLALRGH